MFAPNLCNGRARNRLLQDSRGQYYPKVEARQIFQTCAPPRRNDSERIALHRDFEAPVNCLDSATSPSGIELRPQDIEPVGSETRRMRCSSPRHWVVVQ